MSAGDGRLAGNSLSVAAWTLVSRTSGLLRAVTVAAVLGPTFFGNIYQATNLVPNITYEFLAGSLFASLLVPALVRQVDAGDRQALERLAGGFLGIALASFAVVVVVGVAAGPLIVRLFATGVSDQSGSEAYRTLGGPLLAMLLPQVLLYGVVGTGVAVQNAQGRFALAAAAPVLENAGVIATLLIYRFLLGAEPGLGTASEIELVVLGLGTTGAVALHAAAQWWGAARAGVRLIPRPGWRDPEVRRIVGLAIPSMGYAGLNAARLFSVLVVASSVPGGVVAFQLAVNFFNLPVALGARPVAQALLPQLSRHYLEETEGVRFREALVRGASLVAFLIVPASVAYVTLAQPLARAVSFGDMAGPGGVGLVAVSLASLGAGVMGESALILATHASYARRDASTPLRAMVLRAGVALTGMALTAHFLEGPAVLIALGLTMSASDLLAAAYLTGRIAARLPAHGPALGPALRRAATASLVMAGPAYLAATQLPRLLSGPLRHVIAMAAAAAVGAALFVALQKLMGSPELRSLTDGFGGLRGRGAS